LHPISSSLTANGSLPGPEAKDQAEGDGEQLPGATPLSSTLCDGNPFLQHHSFNWPTHDEEYEEEEDEDDHPWYITPEMAALAAALPGR
jgi:hypothetical protein